MLAALSSAVLGEREAQAWLRHTARFVVAAHYRKAVERREVLDVHAPEVTLADPFELLQAREQTELVHGAIDRLRAEESDLVALHVFGELPFRTLATLYRCDAKTARKPSLAAMRAARRTIDRGSRMRGVRAMASPPQVINDYDRDARTDFVYVRNGTMNVRPSSGLPDKSIAIGQSTHIFLPAVDYTLSGIVTSDVAYFRPSTGMWLGRSVDRTGGDGSLMTLAVGNEFDIQQFGTSTDLPVPGDYDADWTTDPAVFRPSNRSGGGRSAA